MANAIARNERPGVLVVLGLALGAAILLVRGGDLVLMLHPGALAAIILSTFGIWLFLVNHRESLGWEGRYIDLWSIPHFTAGIGLWGLGLDLVGVIVVAIAWELVEIAANVYEHPTNRATDVVLAMLGWTVCYVAA